MTKIKYIIPIVLLIISCTERIDIELNEGDNNRLVVEGGITNEQKVHEIKLSRTGSYFLNQQTPVELGANVTVTDGEKIFVFSDDDDDGVYQTNPDVAGTVGKTYTLNIKLITGEEYTANYTMRELTPMDSINYNYTDSYYDIPQEEASYYIQLYAHEKPGVGDAYMWYLYINSELDSDTLREITFVDDNEVDGNYIHDWAVYTIEDYKITEDVTTVGIEMRSISYDHYDFNISLMLETDWNGGMFQGPPANIPSNISNGGMGFFYASATNYLEIPVYLIQGKHDFNSPTILVEEFFNNILRNNADQFFCFSSLCRKSINFLCTKFYGNSMN